MSKTKLPSAVVAKNDEITQLKNELAAVKSELGDAKHQLRSQKQNEEALRADLHRSFQVLH